jgi:predicted nucleotidyltransferase
MTTQKDYKPELRKLGASMLQEIIRRVVEAANPDRIILFGSAARGDMGPHSDVDLLVIKSGEFDQFQLTGKMYMNMAGVGCPVDMILVTPEYVGKYKDEQWLVIHSALDN